jgi:predicted ester cyclase
MSIGESKQLIRRFSTGVVGGGDYSKLDHFVATDYVDHNAAEESGRGPEVVRTPVESIRMTLPDFAIQIEDIFAEGDHVITRVTGRGTHFGEWMDVEPTGREVRLKGINIDRVHRGRIAEHWGEADAIGMLVQMGVDPFVKRSRGTMSTAFQGVSRVPDGARPAKRAAARHGA